MDTEQYVSWFRSTSPYINSNRGKTFVLALRGELLAHKNCAVLMQDIVLLQSLGVRLVLCIGGKPQLLQALQARGMEPTFVEDTLLVSTEAIATASAVIGDLRHRVEAALSKGVAGARLKAKPIRVVSGNFVTAKPLGVLNGVDHEHSGSVRRIDSDAIKHQLEQSNVLVLPALAGSPTGELFALDVHELAYETAKALRADKLILFSETDGVMDNKGQLIHEIDLAQAEAIQAKRDEQTAWDNLSCAIRACRSGINRTQIVSYTKASALLTELFSRDGSGTLISQELFESIRSARIEDITSVLELIAPLEADGTLVRRSREKLEEEIQLFHVIERDASLIACAALYPFEDAKAAELACVVTHPDYQNSGRAAKLLEHIVKRAKNQGLERIFVLTTKTAHWFLENGFSEASKDDLPIEKLSLYNLQRNSKVLIRQL